MKLYIFAAVAAVTVYANVREPSPEDYAREMTQCYADYLGLGEVEVRFTEEFRWTECSSGTGIGPDGQCPAAGWAWPMYMDEGRKMVTYYHPWLINDCPECSVETTREFISNRAAHEVCHVNDNYGEAEANACAAIAMREAGCS